MVRRSHDPLVEEQSLQHQLQRKSRHRRKERLLLAKASAALRASRNDPLPQLTLASIELDDLNLPARKTRKCTPVHVRKVVGSIVSWDSVLPSLLAKAILYSTGKSGS